MNAGLVVPALVMIQVAAQGTDNLERIHALLARPDVLCGHFEQARTLVGLQRPVKSSGRFCVVATKGILWRTLRPFASSLRLTRDEIVESRGDQVTTRLSAKDEPTVRVINDLLFSLLAGDVKRLTETFDVGARVDGKDWQARLAPRDAGLKRAIGGIELNGGEYVAHLVIRETGGDRTDIAFSAIATGAGAMQPDEAKEFPAGIGERRPD